MSSFKVSCATPPVTDTRGDSRLLQRAWLGAAALACCLLLLAVHEGGWRQSVLLLLGVALGTALVLTSFGFSSAYRAFLVRRETAGIQAQILMLAFATVMFTPVLAAGSAFGQPISGAYAPVATQVVAGAFLFGIGMQLGGGCGSGTLCAVGSGSPRMMTVLVFFVAGSFWASLHMNWWERLPSRGAVVLGDLLGWKEALTLQLGVLAAIWLLVANVRPKRTDRVVPKAGAPERDRSLAVGAVLLALLSFLVLLIAGHPWSITWAFSLVGAKSALLLGWRPGEYAFWNGDFQRRALDSSLLNDVTTLMDVGLILGAAAAAGASGRLRPSPFHSAASYAAAMLGGLAMGYGARIAYGCNVGAFLSGVASTSVHGWVWIVAALGGNVIGVRLRPRFGLRN